MKGYIYLRSNEYWDLYDVYKLGKSSNILDRENNYITSEIKRGKYVMVIELNFDIMDIVETRLQQYFNKLGFHIKFNGGTEFYKKEIIKYIIHYLMEHQINHKVLSDFEIEKLIRKDRVYKYNSHILGEDQLFLNKEFLNSTEQKPTFYNPYKLQQIIIDNAYNYFQENDKGLLILTCGVGKTLISLWITIKLNLQTIIIGVPNKLLLYQWYKTITLLFNKVPYMIIESGVNLSVVCNKLCQLDNNFPPNGLWTEYYKIKNINEIIKISLKKKSKGLI